MNTWIISLGGSIVAPNDVDIDYLCDLYQLLIEFIEFEDCRFVLVVGGGAPARTYQQAFRDLTKLMDSEIDTATWAESQDKIGIQATHLNAMLVKEAFGDLCVDTLVTNPEDTSILFDCPILVGAGWKPGFSTDLDAVLLAHRFEARTIINLSNIAQIYTADPNIDSTAKPLDNISWQELIDMTGEEWTPGMHAPFDPIACARAAEYDLKVICAEGRDLDNLRSILKGEDFIGTNINNT